MVAELLVLRLVHVLGGIFWVGATLFTAIYLTPAMKSAGPAVAGPIMGVMQRRYLFQVMPIVAILTMLSGIRLMMIVSAGSAGWFKSGPGHTFSIAAAFAIIAFLIGVIVVRPSMARMGKLAQSNASDGASKQLIADELAKLQRRAGLSSTIVASLLTLAAVGMAIARYM